MKKEQYFREELQRLFIGLAMVPAVSITLICCFIFMGLLLKGRWEENIGQRDYTAEALETTVDACSRELVRLEAFPGLFEKNPGPEERARIFTEIYRATGGFGCKADFYLLDADRHVILTDGKRVPEALQVAPGVSWGLFSAMEEAPGQTALRLLDGYRQEGSMLALGRAVFEGEQLAGYLIFTLDHTSMQPVLEHSAAQAIVTDPFGWAYLCGNSSFLTDSHQLVREIRGGSTWVTYRRHLYLMSARPVCGGQLLIYVLSDIQNIVVSLALNAALVITALFIMTLWVFAATRKVTEKKTADFYRILEVMDQGRQGNLDCRVQVESNNEFKTIADAYNSMIGSLQQQMENNRRMTELVAIAQSRQLESQFNPHFLYNTLENIRYMCRIEPETASRMIFCLSGLLRYSLDGSRREVPLREDLEHLNNYLTILTYRFGSRLTCTLDVEEATLDCRIPKLVLQPMIENSVKYGFGNRDRLTVELKAYIHQENLVMICRDDGAGMTQTALSELSRLLEQKENPGRHSGLYNIHRRIQLLYGHPYGVEIRSTEGHGTTLIINLPARREERIC